MKHTVRSLARCKGRAGRAALPLLGLLLLQLTLFLACAEETATKAPPAPATRTVSYVSSQRCATCHPREYEAWQRSDHAHAMHPATEEFVAGAFDTEPVLLAGVSTSFERQGDQYFVRTEGADGKIQSYEIAYTFGRDPLQQYLIPFPRGMQQALGIAWDTRPKELGGQRWFHLYPDEPPPAGDPLHWTGREQRWNHQCAECHSTNLEKRYDREHDSYDTRYAEISVGCEACHGAGSAHVTWAESTESARAADPSRGWTTRLGSPPGAWAMLDSERGIATWQGEPRSQTQLDNCARCHARRGPLVETSAPTDPFLDAYRPALLDEGLYHADGQILDEVFEWGSFVQSRMHRAGVLCSDCHDSHSSSLRVPGNAICAQCHLPSKFDSKEHHHHEAGTPGASCVDCHMPMRNYMVIDGRRDHSFRVPRPDLTIELGTPNACQSCHADRGAVWARDAVQSWRGASKPPAPHFARALDAGRRGALDGETRLLELAFDVEQPAIARATAWRLLPSVATARTLEALPKALADADPLVRISALQALEDLAVQPVPEAAIQALEDPLRGVRIAAARALAGADAALFDAAQRAAFERAFEAARTAELALAERPQSWLNLSNLELRAGNLVAAKQCLEQALRLDARFLPAWVNLADLERQSGNEVSSRQALDRAFLIDPKNADVLEALGLQFTRAGDRERGLFALKQAHQLQPTNTRYAYVCAVALYDAGQVEEAMRILERAHRTRPADTEVISALQAYETQRGNTAAAERWAGLLRQLLGNTGR